MVFFLSTCVLHWAQMEARVGQSVSAGPGHLGWCWEDRDRLAPALSLCVGSPRQVPPVSPALEQWFVSNDGCLSHTDMDQCRVRGTLFVRFL